MILISQFMAAKKGEVGKISIRSIDHLFESSLRPVAVFIGSGLSVPEPSSLPTSKEAIVSLLNLDWVEGDEKFPITESQIENSDLYNIRFEHMLSIFNEWGKHDLGNLLRQFNDAPPNWYHKRIAELCQKEKIKCIITTNFDSCIEKALQDYDVAYNVIATHEDKYSDDVNIINIFKIHGTIELSNDRYLARGLGATLESIYSGLETWKKNILLKLLEQYTFVFLGYSGYDSYDINPIFYELSNSHLFWVVHKSSDENKTILSEVTNIIARSKYSIPIQIDTAVFLGGDPLPRRESKFRFIPTYNLENHWHPSVFVGRVLESKNDYRSAKSYYEMVIENSTESLYWMVEILNLFRAKAVSLYELKEYQAASGTLLMAKMILSGYIKRMEKDGSTPEDFKHIFLDQLLLISEEEALIDIELGRKDDSLKNIDQAFKCLNYMDCDEGTKLSIESRLLLNRCSIKLNLLESTQNNLDYSEYLIALEDLKKASRIKRGIGDVTGLIKCLNFLGRIYIILGEAKSAETKFIEMFDEVQKIKTPINERSIDLAIDFVSFLLYNRYADDKNSIVIKYLKNESNTNLEFKNRIKNILINEVHKSSGHIMNSILKDEEIQKCCNKLENEING